MSEYFKHPKYPGSVFEQTNFDGVIRYHTAGGGYSLIDDGKFEPTDNPYRVFYPAFCSGDWVSDGNTVYPCITNGERWNGWGVPYFNKETMTSVVAECSSVFTTVADLIQNCGVLFVWCGDTLYMSGQVDDVKDGVITIYGDDDDPPFFKCPSMQMDGQRWYAIDGWCWNSAKTFTELMVEAEEHVTRDGLSREDAVVRVFEQQGWSADRGHGRTLFDELVDQMEAVPNAEKRRYLLWNEEHQSADTYTYSMFDEARGFNSQCRKDIAALAVGQSTGVGDGPAGPYSHIVTRLRDAI